MAQFDFTSVGPALKEYYSKETVRDLVYEKNPFFGMLQKERIGGKYIDFALEYELPASRSADISKALGNKKASKFLNFNVPVVKDYIAISIDRLTMKSTEKAEYAFFEAQTRAIDSALKNLVRSLSMSLYRNKGGAVGKIATGGVSGATITLADIAEIANFGVNDVIVISSADGSTSTDTLRAGVGLIISSLNRDTGVITFTQNVTDAVNGIPGATAGDFLFKDGDFQAKVAGLDSWCPSSAPGSTDSFFGANRFPDPSRLAGTRVSAIGDPIEEAILKGTSRLGREGAQPDSVFMNNATMRDLLLELGNKVEYEVTGAEEATVGFKGVVFMTDQGKVNCYADHNCPSKKLYVTRMDSLRLIYACDDVPEIQSEDGSVLFREAGTDGFEVRCSYYANMISYNPQETAVVTLAS